MKEEASVKVLASKVGLANLLFFGGEKIIIWKKIFPMKAKQCVSTLTSFHRAESDAEKERECRKLERNLNSCHKKPINRLFFIIIIIITLFSMENQETLTNELNEKESRRCTLNDQVQPLDNFTIAEPALLSWTLRSTEAMN